MCSFTNFSSLLACMAILPYALAVKGTVKVNFPSDSISQLVDDASAQPQVGESREFKFDEVSQVWNFYWKGPPVNYLGASTPSVSSSAVRSSSSSARSPEETGLAGNSQIPWMQTCHVSVDDQFDHDVEFTLRLQQAGFEGPKDQHATIKCDQAICLLPEGVECEDPYAIPYVDSSV
uniref:Phosphatidylglycerol/phosphatidylinositol transfer protein n=1 Tax=Kwoniella bestiolae CBS 10118 TaxID=1296100 RepID=A0A1B9FZ29_9TREE|nr:hypothetical protein I302_06997 [Kwoniella bestiolae CBS 10118]OCF24011.1 hypothetical protein I302_06997 [Kwoniella bestiolae CBS 10118]